MTLTPEMMKAMWPHGDQHVAGLSEGCVDWWRARANLYGINTPLVLAHFMAQCSEECGAGLEMVENLNYSSTGLMRTWPTRFGADRAARYAHSPQMIAEAVYGGRMGNLPPPSQDGWTYRGRGPTQLTGKENYAAVGKALMLDLVGTPDLCNDPFHVWDVGGRDFATCSHEGKTCVQYAAEDDVVGVTLALNGGEIGLADRRAWLHRWKVALGVN